MKIIEFQSVCRSCFCTDDLTTVIPILSDFDFFYSNNKLKSAFEFSNFIAESFKANKKGCKFCGSYNIDIYSIVYDKIKVRRDSNLDFFAMDFNKKSPHLPIEILIDGNKLEDKEFIRDGISLLKETFEDIPYTNFEPKDKGEFTASFTRDEQNNFRIEVLEYMGLSINTIMQGINKIESQYC